MPEAFACFLVFVVAVATYAAAKITALNPANRPTAQAEVARLRQHRAWLDERVQRSWRENWDDDMRARIADEINDVEAALAKTAVELKQAA